MLETKEVIMLINSCYSFSNEIKNKLINKVKNCNEQELQVLKKHLIKLLKKEKTDILSLPEDIAKEVLDELKKEHKKFLSKSEVKQKNSDNEYIDDLLE